MYIIAEAATPKLDSQFRFMSAWDIGLAFVAWWFVAHIERHAGLFRLVCLAVFLGGLGRWPLVHDRFTGPGVRRGDGHRAACPGAHSLAVLCAETAPGRGHERC